MSRFESCKKKGSTRVTKKKSSDHVIFDATKQNVYLTSLLILLLKYLIQIEDPYSLVTVIVTARPSGVESLLNNANVRLSGLYCTNPALLGETETL